MRRYYYTDPIAAAYMHMEYNVAIEAENNCNSPFRVPIKDWCVIDGIASEARFLELGVRSDLFKGNTWVSASTSHKFYIHPDSLHILEPQVGDVIETYDKRTSIPKVGGALKRVRGVNFAEHLFAAQGVNGRIIQRNGKPFFWPECEEQANVSAN